MEEAVKKRPDLRKGDLIRFLKDGFVRGIEGHFFLVISNLMWSEMERGWVFDLYDLKTKSSTDGVWTVDHGPECWEIIR